MSDIESYKTSRRIIPTVIPSRTVDATPTIPTIASTPTKKTKKEKDRIDHFRLMSSVNGKGTTIQVRWSILGLWLLLMDFRRHPVLGFTPIIKSAVYAIAKLYPKDRSNNGISGFVTDYMMKDMMRKLAEIDAIDHLALRYDKVIAAIQDEDVEGYGE